jgi:DNA invertase Pin-like site-specific DNA recombinase
LAFSYVRFSHPEQAKGDSLRRQTEAAADWCRRHGVTLDTATTLHDLGKSAYTGAHRQNPDRHALAGFLKLVEAGRVPRGSYLVIENLDRLSREHIQPALLLALNLLQGGVRIVQLKPSEIVFDSRSDTLPVMMMMMELSRGHGESAMKSERIGAAWRQKKRRAAADRTPVTATCPGWLRLQGGRFVVIPDKAEAVRRVFRLAAAGYSVGAIARTLNAENVPPPGRSGRWARASVFDLLRRRAVLGEYQPGTRTPTRRAADGSAVPGSYPAVVTEDQWHAAQAALNTRRATGGRPPRAGVVNLFAGLLFDARDGAKLHLKTRRYGPDLMNAGTRTGTAPPAGRTFPLAVLERALLARLAEIDPREILPGGDDGADAALTLSGKVADLETRVAAVQAELIAGGDVPALAAVLRALEQQRAAAAEALAAAKAKAASPLSAAWGELGSLLAAVDSAPDPGDVRVRLRSVLRRTVGGVYCVFAGDGPVRFAAAQVHFTGGGWRDYLIVYRRGYRRKAAGADVYSLGDKVGAGPLDLRKRKDAAKLARELETLRV